MQESKEEIWVYKIPVEEFITKLGLKGKHIDDIDDDDESVVVIRTTETPPEG